MRRTTATRPHKSDDDVGLVGPAGRAGAIAHIPPAPPPYAVERARLLSLLDLAARHQRLTLVVAPPGYGKTVLLAQLAASRRRERVRWLALTPEHDTAVSLAKALCDVFDSKARQLAVRLPPLVETGERSIGNRFLTALVGELETMAPTTLVLDDLHVLTRPSLLADLATVLEHAPRTLHVVAATQVDPPGEYYRPGLSDVLVELRQDDLAFTLDEAVALVERIAGVALTPSQAEALVARTEGWGVGLQLAALSLRAEPHVEQFIARFAENPRHVADYLTEHVLDRQPEHIRHFLVSTSVLQRMNGPLCDAVLGQEGSAAVLEYLDSSSLFVTRVGPRRSWFRYHALFRALLRDHLHAGDPDRERALLGRAAAWHLARDEVEQAGAYLIEASAWDEVVDAAFAHGPSLLRQARTSVLVDWLDRVPGTVTAGRVDITLLRSAATIFGGEPAQTADILAAVDAVPHPTVAQRVVGDVLHGYWAVLQGDPGEAIGRARRCLEALDTVADDELVDVVGLTGTRADLVAASDGVLGFAHLQRGELAEARAWVAASGDGSHPLWQSTLLGTRALVEAWSGRLNQSEHLARLSLGLASEVGMRQPANKARVALAHVACERGETEAAAALVDDAEAAVDPRRQRVGAELLVVQRAAIALADRQPAAGLTLLASRRPRERPGLPPWVLVRRSVVEAGLHLAVGDLESAQRTLDVAVELDDPDLLAAQVHVAIERDDLGRARQVLDGWPDDGTPRSRQQRTLWAAILEHRLGHDDQARVLFADVVAAAELEHDVGVFRGAGEHVFGPARDLYLTAPTAFLRGIVERPPADQLAPRTVKGLVEQLTEREYAVLAVLSTRLSNVEIAERFGISLNTVKTHLKHIYRKLGVEGRSEAVLTAERLGLL